MMKFLSFFKKSPTQAAENQSALNAPVKTKTPPLFDLHMTAYITREHEYRGIDFMKLQANVCQKSEALEFLNSMEPKMATWLEGTSPADCTYEISVTGTVANKEVNDKFKSIEDCRTWWQKSFNVKRETLLKIAKGIIAAHELLNDGSLPKVDLSNEEALLSTMNCDDWESFDKWLKDNSLIGDDLSIINDVLEHAEVNFVEILTTNEQSQAQSDENDIAASTKQKMRG